MYVKHFLNKQRCNTPTPNCQTPAVGHCRGEYITNSKNKGSLTGLKIKKSKNIDAIK